ncbi:MAG: hypothetical protein H6948_05125 [Zoogloeaceae bacterium]|nr:hypothetical protein [Rhodocyclaceae bacterium]MCP5231464.1 hypothetical protein [Zoogloeaceae bacterium]MCP5239279.1 hypothetical protein [Zoogloeaceae bacterium]MCP5255866.1 hypothetical protein [Zoogloeaceae bacterium]
MGKVLIVRRFETGSEIESRNRIGATAPMWPASASEPEFTVALLEIFDEARAAMAGAAGSRSSADRCGPAS